MIIYCLRHELLRYCGNIIISLFLNCTHLSYLTSFISLDRTYFTEKILEMHIDNKTTAVIGDIVMRNDIAMCGIKLNNETH